MSGRTEIERALDGFLAEGPDRVTDLALTRALLAIDRTQQRRDLLAPWRFFRMNITSRVAAVAIVALIAVGGAFYLIGPRNGVGNPSAAPSPTIAPPAPTASTAFTSTRYGYSAAYPEGWTLTVATESWRFETRQQFWSSNGDGADRLLGGGGFHMTAFSSVVPAQTTADQWIDSYINVGSECPSARDLPVIEIDGHQGRISTNCAMATSDPQPSPVVEAFVTVGQTMFVFGIDDSDDVLLRAFLETVKLPAA